VHPVALGVLDGVHRGHQVVIAAARREGRPLGAAVFEPHPRHYFRPDGPPFRLQNAAQRVRALEAAGVELVFQMAFDRSIAECPAQDFARVILAEEIGAAHVSVGADFQYGKDRGGDVRTLARAGETLGFTVSVTPPVMESGARISSTAIRALIAEGKVADAAALLTRPFAIEGEVVAGAQRGRTIGFPTANIGLSDYVRPKFGVYAVRAAIEGARVDGVANIGVKPTVGGAPEPLLEAHLFDYAGDLYGKTLEVDLIAFLRPEQKFESFDALKAQIQNDAQAARKALA
jgi:riboflavin kinase / FMN adenylyltransferase